MKPSISIKHVVEADGLCRVGDAGSGLVFGSGKSSSIWFFKLSKFFGSPFAGRLLNRSGQDNGPDPL